MFLYFILSLLIAELAFRIVVCEENFFSLKGRLPIWYVLTVFIMEWIICYFTDNSARSSIFSFITLLSALIVWLVHRPQKIFEYIWAGVSVFIWCFVFVSIIENLRGSIIHDISFHESVEVYYYYLAIFLLYLKMIMIFVLPVSVGFAVLAKYIPKPPSLASRFMYICIISIALLMGVHSCCIIMKGVDSQGDNVEYCKRNKYYKILLVK